MAVETEQLDIVEEIKERIDLLTENSKEEMDKAGSHLGQAVWKFPLAGGFTWLFINLPMRPVPVQDTDVAMWISSGVVAGTLAYYGSMDILGLVHHLSSHNSIMREVSSHRALISRTYEQLLHER